MVDVLVEDTVLAISPPRNVDEGVQEEEEVDEEEVDDALAFTLLAVPPFTLGLVFKSAFVTKFIVFKQKSQKSRVVVTSLHFTPTFYLSGLFTHCS